MSRSQIFRQTSLTTLRYASRSGHSQKRFASTFSRRGRATGALLRWGLAGAAVYYYNTASVFADEPIYAQTPEIHRDAETYTTVDTIAAQRRAQARASVSSETPSSSSSSSTPITDGVPITDGSPQQLEEEAEQQGAFNEETGEINWDCPCLGGMAEGPCGEQFKAAFSCFVFSKEEPKGIDCIEHFKTMQNCFREHPDVYGSELEADDEEPIEEPQVGVSHAVDVAREHVGETVEKVTNNLANDTSAVASEVSNHTPTADVQSSRTSTKSTAALKSTDRQTRSKDASENSSQSTSGDEGGDLVPKAWHNSSDDNRSK